MAVRYAIEGEALNFGASATWGGGAPANGDILMLWGRHKFTSGLDQATVNLDGLIAQRGASVEFDGLLKVDVDSAGPGLLWQASDGSLRFDGDTNKAVLDCPGLVPSIEGGTHDEVVCARGRAVVNDSSAVTSLTVAREAVCAVLEHASSRLGSVRVAGVLETRRSLEAGVVSGRGRVIFSLAATVSDGAAGGLLELVDDLASVVFLNNQSVTADEIRIWAGARVNRQMAGVLTVTDETRTPLSYIESHTAQAAVVHTNTPTDIGTPGSGLHPQFAALVGA